MVAVVVTETTHRAKSTFNHEALVKAWDRGDGVNLVMLAGVQCVMEVEETPEQIAEQINRKLAAVQTAVTSRRRGLIESPQRPTRLSNGEYGCW